MNRLPAFEHSAAPSTLANTCAPLRVLTWHVHGNYLYALSQVPHEFIIPVCPNNRPGYSALGNKIPWGPNIKEVPLKDLARERLDCIIYQSQATYEESREYLSKAHAALPAIYLEHNPPLPHPVDTVHPFTHKAGMLVHVTHHNALYWQSDDMPVRVIEHSVPLPTPVRYSGIKPCGIAVVNGLNERGRRVGQDIFLWMRERAPLDLLGMGSEAIGGLGEVGNIEVGQAMADYRFFFSPVRYGSLSLALVEAMLIGMPIVGLAATELPTIITNGVNGYVHTDKRKLLDVMQQLLDEPELARQWGMAARATALQRFSMNRFIADWLDVIAEVTTQHAHNMRPQTVAS